MVAQTRNNERPSGMFRDEGVEIVESSIETVGIGGGAVEGGEGGEETGIVGGGELRWGIDGDEETEEEGGEEEEEGKYNNENDETHKSIKRTIVSAEVCYFIFQFPWVEKNRDKKPSNNTEEENSK